MASFGAKEIGCSFVQKYYDVLQKNPELAQGFYREGSALVRAGADSEKTATTLTSINELLTSLKYEEVVNETIDCANSFNGGITVQLTASVKTKKVNSEGVSVEVKKKVMQTLSLAQEGTVYFVMTDILRYLEDEAVDNKPKVLKSDAVLTAKKTKVSPPTMEKKVSPQTVEVSPKTAQVSSPTVEKKVSPQTVEASPQTIEVSPSSDVPAEEKPVQKLSFASIAALAPKENPAAEVVTPIQKPKPTGPKPTEKSVFVTNLPPDFSITEFSELFARFGRIKKDGMYLSKTDTNKNSCFGFVDFENAVGAQKAVEASPLVKKSDGRQVFIQLKRENTKSRGGNTKNTNTGRKQ